MKTKKKAALSRKGKVRATTKRAIIRKVTSKLKRRTHVVRKRMSYKEKESGQNFNEGFNTGFTIGFEDGHQQAYETRV